MQLARVPLEPPDRHGIGWQVAGDSPGSGHMRFRLNCVTRSSRQDLNMIVTTTSRRPFTASICQAKHGTGKDQIICPHCSADIPVKVLSLTYVRILRIVSFSLFLAWAVLFGVFCLLEESLIEVPHSTKETIGVISGLGIIPAIVSIVLFIKSYDHCGLKLEGHGKQDHEVSGIVRSETSAGKKDRSDFGCHLHCRVDCVGWRRRRPQERAGQGD